MKIRVRIDKRDGKRSHNFISVSGCIDLKIVSVIMLRRVVCIFELRINLKMVLTALNKLKSNRETGIYYYPSNFVRGIKNVGVKLGRIVLFRICWLLTHFYWNLRNQLLYTYKICGSKIHISKYKPILILNVFSTIFEKIVHNLTFSAAFN